MDDAPSNDGRCDEAATGEARLAGRGALVALARLLARQAAREALTASHIEQEIQNDDEEA